MTYRKRNSLLRCFEIKAYPGAAIAKRAKSSSNKQPSQNLPGPEFPEKAEAGQQRSLCLHRLFYGTLLKKRNFFQRGGVIQATPNNAISKQQAFSVSFLIEPDGTCELLGTFDKISSEPYQNFCCSMP